MELYEFIPVFSILVYLPFACWSDWKHRIVPPSWTLALALVNVPSLYFYLISSPDRNYWLLGLSLVMCLLVFFLFALLGGIGGGDFWLASVILIFVQYNPFKFPRMYFPLDFFVAFLFVILYLMPILWMRNWIVGHRWRLWQMFTYYPRGVPFMIPLSFAFIATLVFEMVFFK